MTVDVSRTLVARFVIELLLKWLHCRLMPTSSLNPRIKSAASDSSSTTIIDDPTSASASEEESPAKIEARVKVKVSLKVYHIPKVQVELNGKEGEIKEYVVVWKEK
ncbi:unnamed protein product [Lactuca virosa]|uniref:Ferredoxin thioredoxin reductase alpha chain domain-containing protein n=1 Tax=Lactuca virosa TaxID=75947 RepID=A0AAU9M1M1_9ASTR|nr:unnamed protein product [Lactuca virosa]